MGLGESRKRTKFSYDPNNTAWTREIDNYGQRMLQSQGWVPGASLGARNKPYSRPRGIAHVRVALKDDNLGLGARRGGGPAVLQTGLDAFQGLLGRLNGKSDAALATEQETRDGLRRVNYVEQRWGPMRFVSGGVLVGDCMEQSQSGQRAVPALDKEASSTTPKAIRSSSEATEDTLENTVADASVAASTAKKTGKSKTRKKDRTQANADQISEIKAKSHDTVPAATFKPAEHATTSTMRRASAEEKERKRAEKVQRKLERRSRKEAKSARKKAALEEGEGRLVADRRRAPEEGEIVTVAEDTQPAPSPCFSRQAVRLRYIQQKKMAVADPRALNEILMVKG
ncbi:MAG: hypothetical protein Q9191_007763 [Dirinaria sp. TL-2023a]